jgi:nucleoside 2-deoxyribosyltransferase
MKIFLAGSFQEPKNEELLRLIYEILKDKNHDVWWAPEKNKIRGYGSNDAELIKNIIKRKELAIKKCDVLVAVMKKATFGTAMEIKQAFDNKIPVIAYILSSDCADFESAAFNYRVSTRVKDATELLEEIENLEGKTDKEKYMGFANILNNSGKNNNNKPKKSKKRKKKKNLENFTV